MKSFCLLVRATGRFERRPDDFSGSRAIDLSRTLRYGCFTLTRISWPGASACVLGAAFAAPGLARASPPSVEIQCEALSREHVAEVEARARAELMTNGSPVLRADLECSVDRVTVTVNSEGSSIAHAVALRDRNVRDALIEALGVALLRLLHPEPAPKDTSGASGGDAPGDGAVPAAPARPPATALGPAAPVNVTAPVAPSSATTTTVPFRDGAPGVHRRPKRTAEVSGGPALEWWQQRTAVGASLEASYGSRPFAFVVQTGALTAAPSTAAFGALELSAALAFRFQPDWSHGARATTGIGAGWLRVDPREPYAPQGATHVSAAYALLELSRPVWWGAWAFVPRAGVRLFAAERRVTLDGRAKLVLGHAAPGVAFGVARAFD
jgi:hypothetical protein